MFSPNFSLCFSIIISTSIGLLIATSLFYSLLSSLLSPSSSRSLFSGRSTLINKSPHSTLVNISPPLSQDSWENVDYYFFFRLRTSCNMGKPVSKPAPRRKYRTINMCGNLCHLPLIIRRTEAREKVLQEEAREEGETTAARDFDDAV
jgi:hypothetical protein